MLITLQMWMSGKNSLETRRYDEEFCSVVGGDLTDSAALPPCSNSDVSVVSVRVSLLTNRCHRVLNSLNLLEISFIRIMHAIRNVEKPQNNVLAMQKPGYSTGPPCSDSATWIPTT